MLYQAAHRLARIGQLVAVITACNLTLAVIATVFASRLSYQFHVDVRLVAAVVSLATNLFVDVLLIQFDAERRRGDALLNTFSESSDWNSRTQGSPYEFEGKNWVQYYALTRTLPLDVSPATFAAVNLVFIGIVVWFVRV